MGKPRIADILCPIIQSENITKMAEIGVYTGVVTKSILVEFPEIYYCAVDPWKSYTGIGAGTLARVQSHEWDKYYNDMISFAKDKPNLHIMRETSITAAKSFPDNFFGLVFIDSVHDYPHCKADILTWFKKVKRGGILCGHDYSKRYKGVIKAVDELIPNRKLYGCTIWGIRKG